MSTVNSIVAVTLLPLGCTDTTQGEALGSVEVGPDSTYASIRDQIEDMFDENNGLPAVCVCVCVAASLWLLPTCSLCLATHGTI